MKPKILVVDDEPLSLKLIEESLLMDYDVVTASSGMEALIKAEKNAFALILLDIMMPNMNGYAVYRYLKSNNKTRSIPVMMVTSLKENEDKMKAAEADVDDFMSKPINVRELRARVKTLLKRQCNCSFPAASIFHIYKVF